MGPRCSAQEMAAYYVRPSTVPSSGIVECTDHSRHVKKGDHSLREDERGHERDVFSAFDAQQPASIASWSGFQPVNPHLPLV